MDPLPIPAIPKPMAVLPVEPAPPPPLIEKPVRERMWPSVGWGRQLIAVFSLLLIIMIFYSNSYKAGMTLDNKYIIDEYYKSILKSNPDHDLYSWKQIELFFGNDYWWPKGISGLYRPITSMSYWFNLAFLEGKAPKIDFEGNDWKAPDGRTIAAGEWKKLSWFDYFWMPGQLPTSSYHTVNLLLHWITAMLIYFVALSLTKRFWVGFFTAALFATHPITTESVTNIIGRADILAAIAVIGGLLVYMRSCKSRGLWRTPWLFGLMLICTFGFFSKESSIAVGVIVPFYWLVFEFDWKKQWAKLPLVDIEIPTLLKELLVWCVMIPPLVLMLWARSQLAVSNTPAEEPFLDNPIRGTWLLDPLNLPSFQQEFKARPLLGMSYIECKLTAVKVMGKLLTLVAFPKTLCCDYSYAQFPNFSFTFKQGWEDWQTIVWLVVLLGLLALGGFLYFKNHRAAAFFIGFFFLAALPTSNFLYTIGSIMAERFMYLPLMGFTGAMVLGLFALGKWIWQKAGLIDRADVPGYSVLVCEFLGLIVIVYGVRTFLRNPVWKNDVELWKDAINTSRKSFRSYQSLAFALWEEYPQNGFDQLIFLDEQALNITETLPRHMNSSRLYLHLGMYHQLKGDSLCKEENGNTLIPPEAQAHYQRAIQVLEEGVKIDRAFDEVNYAKQIQRGDLPEKIYDVGLAPVYDSLATCYDRMGDDVSALNRLGYAEHLDPTDADVHVHMGMIYLTNKQFDDAARMFIEALLINRDLGTAWQGLLKTYQNFGQEGAISIIQGPDGKPVLNMDVKSKSYEHLQLAYRDLIRKLRWAHKFGQAETLRNSAINVGVPAEFLNQVMTEPVPTVTPEGVRYDLIQPWSIPQVQVPQRQMAPPPQTR